MVLHLTWMQNYYRLLNWTKKEKWWLFTPFPYKIIMAWWDLNCSKKNEFQYFHPLWLFSCPTVINTLTNRFCCHNNYIPRNLMPQWHKQSWQSLETTCCLNRCSGEMFSFMTFNPISMFLQCSITDIHNVLKCFNPFFFISSLLCHYLSYSSQHKFSENVSDATFP